MSKKYLAAVDGSDHGWRALGLAVDMALATQAELIVLHVVAHEPNLNGLTHFAQIEGMRAEELTARYHLGKEIGDGITAEAVARARAAGLDRVEARVVEGRAAQEIVVEAEVEKVDMLFVGSRGLSDAASLLMGGVSHKVLQISPCTCVAVK